MITNAHQIQLRAELERLKVTVNEFAELAQAFGCLPCVRQHRLVAEKLNRQFAQVASLRETVLESQGIVEDDFGIHQAM